MPGSAAESEPTPAPGSAAAEAPSPTTAEEPQPDRIDWGRSLLAAGGLLALAAALQFGQALTAHARPGTQDTLNTILNWSPVALVTLVSLGERRRLARWAGCILSGLLVPLLLALATRAALARPSRPNRAGGAGGAAGAAGAGGAGGEAQTTPAGLAAQAGHLAAQAAHSPEALVLAATALLLAACFVPAVRRLAARALPIDPARPMHTLALQLGLLVLTLNVVSQLHATALDPSSYRRLNAIDQVVTELPLLATALAATGLLTRRSLAGTIRRLGVVRPTWVQATAALLAAQALWLTSLLFAAAAFILTPDQVRQLARVSAQIYGGFGRNPLPWIVLSLSAGVCEEILFRGALQPRLGLPLTAVLFAAVHVQYGISIVLGLILVSGLALGLLRRYANTTACIICHAAYDLMVSIPFPPLILALGFVAVLVEAVVIPVLAWRWWSRVRQGWSPLPVPG